MAVALDATSIGTFTSGTTISWTHTPVGTPTAVGVAITMTDAVVSGVTYGGTAMTEAIDGPDVAGDDTEIWGLGNPASGAQTVVVTFSDAPGVSRAVAYTVTGSDTTTVFSNTSSASGVSATPSTTCTTATGELVIDIVCTRSGTAAAPGAAQTEVLDQNTASHNHASSHQSGDDGGVMSWSITSGAFWSQCAASFKVGSAAAGFGPLLSESHSKLIGGGLVLS